MSSSPAAPLPATPTVPPSDGLKSALTRNIDALSRRRQAEEQRASTTDKLAGAITHFAGTMAFVYLHAALVGGWVVANLGLTPLQRFDPSFVILATTASVEAIFLSTFILISQNRAARNAASRADLDLQISLLAEHEVTRLIKLVGDIARKLGVEEAGNAELRELERTVAPEAVLEHIEEKAERAGTGEA